MNEFYSIAQKEVPLENPLQLKNLGEQIIYATVGINNGFQKFYRKTTNDDYDRYFAFKISSTKPPYEILKLLNYHFDYYLNDFKGERGEFLNQIKYVVVEIIKKKKDKNVYIEIINEWIENKQGKEKELMTKIVNNISIGDINAPSQFQQNSDNSTQTQQLNYSKEDIIEILSSLRKDISTLKGDQREDFETEIDYAIKQINKGRNVDGQLMNIGLMVKEIGLPLFLNLVACAAFEILKPLLGFD